MPDKEFQPATSPPTPEEQALVDELKALYDNPEVFFDVENADRRDFAQFRIISPRILGQPSILYVQIDTNNVSLVLREAILGMFDSDTRGLLQQDYGTSSWDETRQAILSDPEYGKTEGRTFWFFVRHFPGLTIKLYGIAMQMALLASIGNLFDDDPKGREEAVRGNLKLMLRDLEKEIKRMLGTRKRGGSRSKLDANRLQVIHVHYDTVHQLAKPVKKHCDAMLKEFEQSRGRRGYTQQEWREFWKKHAYELYGYPAEFLALFAELEKPSASEVAYAWIARGSGHAVNYTKRLVLASRKKATMK